MDALFFLTRREDAIGVSCSRDLPCDPATEPLRLEEPSPLAGLARMLGVEPRVRPLRDATCQSFPVWELGGDVTRGIAGLDDTEIDDLAERWLKHDETALDADLFELASCLGDLREAIREGQDGDGLFVLLEERAW